MGRSEPSRARQVVALRHDPESGGAPQVVAKGQREVADRILSVAREHGVAVREDSDLLQLLALCDLGEEIPSELYQAVAELLAYLYQLNDELASDPG